jgi:hypothetical protein
VTRRELLLGLGAQLCACNATPRARPATPVRSEAVEYSPIMARGGQSPLLFAGGKLVRATETRLDVHDRSSLAKTGEFDVAAALICALDAARIAAMVDGAGLHVIDLASGAVERFVGAGVLEPRSLIAAGPREVLIADDSDVTRYRLDGGALIRIAQFPLPSRARPPGRRPGDQLIAVGDRLVYPVYRGLAVFEADRQSLTCEIDEAIPFHVAPAAKDRVWYSDYHAPTLVLGALGPAVQVERAVDLAPGAIVHLASAGELAAVAVGVEGREPHYDIAAVDASGAILWRDTWLADLAGSPRLLAVAIGGDRVAAIAGDSPLAGWDLKTGRRLGA